MSTIDTPTADPATEAAEAAKRSRGRPTIAELEARQAELDAREEALTLAEKQAELDAAEANLVLRDAELLRMQTATAGARSQSVRSEPLRADPVTENIRVQRRYRGGEMPNEFHIEQQDIPKGLSYQWNNHTLMGQKNPSYDSFMGMQGWVPVPASRHPHLVPPDAKPDDPIIVKGQILVERPEYLTQEAIREDYQRAVGEVARKEEQLYGTPQGTMPRSRANGSQDFIQVQKTVEPGAPVAPNYQYDNANGPVIE